MSPELSAMRDRLTEYRAYAVANEEVVMEERKRLIGHRMDAGFAQAREWVRAAQHVIAARKAYERGLVDAEYLAKAEARLLECYSAEDWDE